MNLTEDEMDEFDVLLCANEDMRALWEARQELLDNTRAEKAIKSLCARGWISLWLAESWTNWNEHELSPEESAAFLAKLNSDDCYWYPTGDVTEPFYCFLTTPEGERIYREDEKAGLYYKEEWSKRAKQRGTLIG